MDAVRDKATANLRKLTREKDKKLDHVKYFHNHVLKNLKLEADVSSSKLTERLKTLDQELTLKNKQLSGTASTKDVDSLVASIRTD